MKKLGLMIALGLIVAGCSTTVTPNGTVTKAGDTTTYSDNKGNSATVSDNGTATYKNDKGETAQIGGTVSEADLGLPFYPGSTEKPNASMKGDTNGEKSAMISRTTKDDPDKVVAFYKDKIPGGKDSNFTTGDTKMGTVGGKLSDGGEASVMATRKGTEDTEIVVTVTHKKS